MTLLLLSLSFCRGILVSFSFLCCCSLYFSGTECPPYDLVFWIDGSVPFLFGKDGSGVLANRSLCGIEVTPSFSAGPVCSSFSAEACTILHALCWLVFAGSTNKSAISLLFSFYQTLALSPPPCSLSHLSLYLNLC